MFPFYWTLIINWSNWYLHFPIISYYCFGLFFRILCSLCGDLFWTKKKNDLWVVNFALIISCSFSSSLCCILLAFFMMITCHELMSYFLSVADLRRFLLWMLLTDIFFFHDFCLAIFLDVWELDIWYFGLHRYGYNCYDEGMILHWLLSVFGCVGKYVIKE